MWFTITINIYYDYSNYEYRGNVLIYYGSRFDNHLDSRLYKLQILTDT